MNKKVLRAGAVSAVAAGIGAAAVMAGKRRSKKEEENSDYRNTELGKFAKNSKGIYYTNGNYEAFARPEKPEGIEEKSAYLVGSGLAALAAACFLVRDAQMPGKNIHILEAMDQIRKDPVYHFLLAMVLYLLPLLLPSCGLPVVQDAQRYH